MLEVGVLIPEDREGCFNDVPRAYSNVCGGLLLLFIKLYKLDEHEAIALLREAASRMNDGLAQFVTAKERNEF